MGKRKRSGKSAGQSEAGEDGSGSKPAADNEQKPQQDASASEQTSGKRHSLKRRSDSSNAQDDHGHGADRQTQHNSAGRHDSQTRSRKRRYSSTFHASSVEAPNEEDSRKTPRQRRHSMSHAPRDEERPESQRKRKHEAPGASEGELKTPFKGKDSGKREHLGRKFKRQRSTEQRQDSDAAGAGARAHGGQPSRRKSSHPRRPQHVVIKNNKHVYPYGNYHQYYGYRTPNVEEDPRLKVLHASWLEGKDCLDVGCNVGTLTFEIARVFKVKSMHGLDIDEELIKRAQKHVRYQHSVHHQTGTGETKDFPISFLLSMGPLPMAPAEQDTKRFPFNVTFEAGNVIDMPTEKQYDTVLCLSVTKWVHLNWGDAGLKAFFAKIRDSTRPGGTLILEPQPWSTYKKKRYLTHEIYSTYKTLQFKPADFVSFLTSDEGGFESAESFEVKDAKTKGFCRPIYVLKRRAS